MFAVDKPYIKKLLDKHRNFLYKCFSNKSYSAKKLLIKKASLFELNILVKYFFLLVHHHIELRKTISNFTKKYLLSHFYNSDDYHKLLYSNVENKKIVLQKLISSFSKLLSPLFDEDE